jgi:hypothetical protein
VKPHTPIPRFTLEEWRAEGVRVCGTPDPMRWAFKCPICGNVARVEDFKGHVKPGTSADYAARNCIGRVLGESSRAFGAGKTTAPCDYTLGGLFVFAGAEVAFDDGKIVGVFAFAAGAS